MTARPITTDRLVLRQWQDADRQPFAELNADPEVMAWFPRRLSRQESDAFVVRIAEAMERDPYGLFALEVRSTAAFIGFTGLAAVPFEAPFVPAVEVGWRLARSAWGHGFATDAATAVLATAFTELGLTEVVSMTATGNRRSCAVMERLGMTRDPADDFDHPRIAVGHPLRRHVLYRITAEGFATRPARR